MQLVTNEQIYDRWEQVPEALKEAFFSVDNGERVWTTCESAGLPSEVIDNVLIVMGNILLGFTHINDLAKELQSIPGMTPEAIDRIIFQIDTQIFDPIRVEILKLYAEMAGSAQRVETSIDLRYAQGNVVPREQSKGSDSIGVVQQGAPVIIETKPIGDSVAPTMIATEQEIAAPVATEEQIESVEIRKVRIEDDQIKQPIAPIGAQSREAVSNAPVMIHTEADLAPVAQKRRALSSFGGMFGFHRGQEPKKEESGAAAQVSMIEGLGRKPGDVAKTAQQPVRVVHYTSAKAPEDIFAQPTPPQGQPVALAPMPTQGQVKSFEQKIVDLGAVATARETVVPAAGKMVPVPPMPEEGKPIATMPKVPEAMVMKTPQRTEMVAEQTPPVKEIKLSEIPVSDDVVDLRSMERVTDKNTN